MSLPDTYFTRDEAEQLLSIPLVLPEKLAASDVEAILRDGLMRLYQAVAERKVVAAAVPEPELVVAKGYEEVHDVAPKRRGSELRRAPRYHAESTLTGTFREVEFTILEISATGLRIRHDESLRPGDDARVTFTVPPSSYTVRARVAWTTIAQGGQGPSFCVSGLQVTANIDHLQNALEHFRKLEKGQKKRAAMQAPAPLAGLSDDDVAAIIRAYRLFTSDPVEAGRWYSRARFSVVDEKVRSAAPERPRDRDEILGIWEFLERKVAIDAVTSVIHWLRQTRSAAAV